MSDLKRIEGKALREFEDLIADTLEAVQREAMTLERLPEGEEPRGSTVLVDGVAITPEPRRIRGKLTVRW